MMERMRDHKLLTYCVHCKTQGEVLVDWEDYVDWTARGKLIQDALPYLTVGERELLISGLCGECFDELFYEEDEEE